MTKEEFENYKKSCETCSTLAQMELPIDEKASAAVEFSMNWAKYRDGQRSMLAGIVSYLETVGHPNLANRVKEKFSGEN